MKKPREYKASNFAEYCDYRITIKGYNVFEIVEELWQEIQELKQDLASYQEVYGKEQNDADRN